MRLIYVMDPMCAWCYAFQPEFEDFLSNQTLTMNVDWIMGGLAPDNDTPMDDELRQTISSYWHTIEGRTRVSFNHDYWQRNTPYRSTYQACRAVISAEKIKTGSSSAMVKQIQNAYYNQAQNPSLDETLVDCASSIGIDQQAFSATLQSEETEQNLQQHLSIAYQLKVTGFPALFAVDDNNRAYALALGFCTHVELEQRMQAVKNSIGNTAN